MPSSKVDAPSTGGASPGAAGDTGPDSGKLSLLALIGLVVGSMIGGGVFSLPQNIAASAAAGPIIIGWIITGIGMICLAFVYQFLANRKPELDNGVYAYARAGFGDYMGFNSAWGYWLSALIGNVGYLVLLMSTIGKFLPIFEGGNTLPAIIVASVLLWLTHLLIIKGIQTATLINTITTIAKIVPIFAFIAIAAFGFHYDLFVFDFWGEQSGLGSIVDQTRNMMLVTVWVFIGIEGASIYSKRARNRKDVGTATIVGFIFVLAVLVLVNLLSLGIMQRAEIAELPDASMGDVLAEIVGPWGVWFVSIAVIISVLGALLAWILLCGETMQIPGTDGTMPSFFGRLNENDAPANALLVTNIVTQVVLLATMLSSNVYYVMATFSAALILVPYLLSALYALLVTSRGETYTGDMARGRAKDLTVSIIATLYGFWLIYAAGLGNLALATLLYLPGIIVYIWAKKENGQRPYLKPFEYIILAVLVLGAAYAVYGLSNGAISLL